MSKNMAVLDSNNVVINIVIAKDEEPETDTLRAYGADKKASIGWTYDADRDAFIPPKPFESWVLNEETCLWEAPLPYPEDGGSYSWSEDLFAWELISE